MRTSVSHYHCFLLALLLHLVSRSAMAGEVLPFHARLADGTRVHGKVLGTWDDRNLVPMLDGQAWTTQNPPVWLRANHVVDAPSSPAWLEWVGGDRLPGTVVGWSAGSDDPFHRTLGHLIVDAQAIRNANHRVHLRVLTTALRRIVWQPRSSAGETSDRGEHNTAWLRSGRRISFSSFRWQENGLALLSERAVERVAFAELAELNLPTTDPWDAYTWQLAGLTCADDSRLLTVDLRDGARLTTSAARTHMAVLGPKQPPTLCLQPAWSLDSLAVVLAEVRQWQSLAPTELPLSWFEPTAVRHRRVFAGSATWRRDRNAEGETLLAAGQRYVWGLGVHAHHEFDFAPPESARAFQTRFALDARSRDGGCVRAKIVLTTDGKNARSKTLWDSPAVVGAAQAIDSGELKLPSGTSRQLTLIADMAHERRPRGADPFDIRDTCNWLEPLIVLDAAALAREVRRRGVEFVPAWNGWTLDSPRETRLFSRWIDKELRFATEVRPAAESLVLRRNLRVRSDDRFLMLFAARQLHATNATRLRVFAGDELLAELDVPPTKPDDEPDPLLVPLEKLRGEAKPTEDGAEISFRIEQTAAGERSFTAWHELKTVPRRPGELRLFEGEQRLTIAEPGVAAMHSRTLDLRVARIPKPGEFRFFRFAWKKSGGSQIRVTLRGGEKQIVYQVGSPSASGLPLVLPSDWLSEIRDLWEDFGQRDTTLTNITLEAPDGDVAWFDDLVAVRNLRDLDTSAPIHPLGELPRQMKRGWGTEMHGEMIRQISPDFNTSYPNRAVTVSLFSRYGGRTAVIDTDSAHVFAQQLTVPADLRTRLELTVGRRLQPWKLRVRVGTDVIHEQTIPRADENVWEDVSVDLSRFAGKSILLETYAEGGATWAKLRVVSE